MAEFLEGERAGLMFLFCSHRVKGASSASRGALNERVGTGGRNDRGARPKARTKTISGA